MLERLLSLLKSVTDESTVEDLRQTLADALDEAVQVKDFVTALNERLTNIEADNATKDSEIQRLREANGRLFTERMMSEDTNKKRDELPADDNKKIEQLLNELDY